MVGVNKVVINKFANRQIGEEGAKSSFSHFSGTAELLADIVASKIKDGIKLNKEGTILKVPYDLTEKCGIDLPNRFFTGIVHLQEGDKLAGSFKSRKEGEKPRKQVNADTGSKKIPARSVEFIVYSSKLLAKDGDNDLTPMSGNWEVISINASPYCKGTPITPETLMYNHFGGDGGTSSDLSEHEFVEMLKESFEFWNDKAQLQQ